MTSLEPLTKCDIIGCKLASEYVYYGKKVCGVHWQRHINGRINLKKIFGIVVPPDTIDPVPAEIADNVPLEGPPDLPKREFRLSEKYMPKKNPRRKPPKIRRKFRAVSPKRR